MNPINSISYRCEASSKGVFTHLTITRLCIHPTFDPDILCEYDNICTSDSKRQRLVHFISYACTV
eukprot:338606-Pyramimonas_sp.AAC.1